MNREELAALFTAACIARLDTNSVDFETAFRWSDEFLTYAAKQREPKACEHVWHEGAHGNFFCTLCRVAKVNPEPPKPDVCEYCGDTFKEGDGHSRTTIGPMPVLSCPKHPTNQPSFTMKQPEPPKPERVAREVWVCFNSDGTPMYAWGTQDREGTRKLFREVLPEEGK